MQKCLENSEQKSLFLRPSELANDTATTNDVIVHLVAWFESTYSKRINNVAILQPTSPLRNATHIKKAAKMKDEKLAKAIVSVCELEHPIEFCNHLKESHSMDGFIDKEKIQRTQDFKSCYRLNGAIYYFERSYVGNLEQLYSEGTYAYIMEPRLSIDIDVEDDFSLAAYYLHR